MSDRAPLFVHCFDLAAWLLHRLDRDAEERASHRMLAECLRGDALALLESVSLALKGFEREVEVERADSSLARLRVHARLAQEMGLLQEGAFLHLTERLDPIGRQIGGWRRSLDGVS